MSNECQMGFPTDVKCKSWDEKELSKYKKITNHLEFYDQICSKNEDQRKSLITNDDKYLTIYLI